MSFAAAEKIANAVLYEGYLLYPYRKSAIKNQQRWHFGTLEPGGGEGSRMQTQGLAVGSGCTALDVKVRFLQGEEEREVLLRVATLDRAPVRHEIRFAPIEGEVEIESERLDENAYRFTVRIANLTARSEGEPGLRAMLSVHTLLGIEHGQFISLLDPPEEYRTAAAACRNIGTWPVLAGAEGDRTLMLSSPIILYDYPQIAPESAGDFFDGTEIDEMLTLRVLTLSDDEKRELREGDDRGRDILARTETLPPEQLAKLHGAVRSLRTASRLSLRPGDRVRLRPNKNADIFDLALAGRVAIVESVERDFEDRVHLAVTIEDDPGRDLGMAHQIGHRFFFSPDEVELL